MNAKEIKHISAQEFAKKYKLGELEKEQCVDVREPEEWEIYHLDQFKLIPLGDLPNSLDDLDREKPIYLLCAHGVRSLYAANFLLRQGFLLVVNVDGGLAEVSLYLDHANN
jgi:rhodanese-related sulfurtransferase